jgi:hypothetical protein
MNIFYLFVEVVFRAVYGIEGSLLRDFAVSSVSIPDQHRMLLY